MSTSATLNKFVEAVMDPLPDAVLLDTHFGILMRQTRIEPWRRAEATTQFAFAKKRMLCAAQALALNDRALELAVEAHALAVADWRAAVAAQILTPSPRQEAVAWKKRAAKIACLPISQEAAAAEIAADEAWLAAHPVKCPKRRPA